MGKVLRGGAYGPDGGYVAPGQPPAKDWPGWFVADLEEHGQLVDSSEIEEASTGDSNPVTIEGRSSRGRKAGQ